MAQASQHLLGERRWGQDEMITKGHKDTFGDGEYYYYLDR